MTIKMNGKVFRGDCLKTIEKIKSNSIQTVITSPPYWKLRSYDLDGEEVQGEFGGESTPDEFADNIVLLFEKIKRVLRDDGTVWLNLGDCYNDPGSFGSDFDEGGKRAKAHKAKITERRRVPGLKRLDLIGVPWLTAFKMREAGWYLRSDIIWSKKSFMPNSVKNRPMTSHEYIFLFAKTPKYYYDQFAILNERGAFPRDVWRLANFKERNLKHFATFPLELPIRAIRAGTSEHGCCAKCGAPYKRKVKVIRSRRNIGEENIWTKEHKKRFRKKAAKKGVGTHKKPVRALVPLKSGSSDSINYRETTGWEKQCECKTSKVKPCRVLDPFMGSGTTAVAAERLHRRWVGLELYKSNCKIVKNRVLAEICGSDFMTEKKRKAVKKIGFGLSKKI